MEAKQGKLRALAKRLLKDKSCALAKSCTQPVPGEGSASAKIVFVGEAPGRREDEQGRPFIGAAGKLLDELLTLIHFKRKDVYITNIVKFRPPKNRDPRPKEIDACWPYLKEEMEIIRPQLIVLLGRHALNRFIPNSNIGKMHGQAIEFDGIHNKNQLYFPMYHPAAALYNPKLRETLKKDIRKIPAVLRRLKNERTRTSQ